MEECPKCKAEEERQQARLEMIAIKRLRQKRQKQARDDARRKMLEEIREDYQMNEDDSYEIYCMWRDYLENWG